MSLKSSGMTLALRASLVQHGSSELKILKVNVSNFNERNMLLALIILGSFLAKQTVVSRCVDFFCVMDLATNYSQRDVLITGTVFIKKLKEKISGRKIVKKQELNNIESLIFMHIFLKLTCINTLVFIIIDLQSFQFLCEIIKFLIK